jgi:phospholipid/cholesterol/gamma-HCH transport system substrate-binding protein
MNRLERLYSPPEIGAPGKRAAVGVRRDLFLAGLFVLTMVAVVAGTLALLMPGLFGGSLRLYAYFPDAAGLASGIQVSQAGYDIGVVEAVEPVFPEAGFDPCPDPNPIPTPGAAVPRTPSGPCFRATLRIRAGWPIPRDSIAQLASAGLLQGQALRILPGQDRGNPLADGDRIRVVGREADLVEQLGRLTDSLQTLVEQTIAPALAGIARQIAALQELLGTGPVAKPGTKADADRTAATGDGTPGSAAGAGAAAADGKASGAQGDGTTAQGGTDAAAEPGGRERLAGVFDNLQNLSANLEAALDPQKLSGILSAVEQIAKDLAGVSGTLSGQSQNVQKTVKDYGALAADLRALIKHNRPGIDSTVTDSQYVLQELAASLAPILEQIETSTRNLAEVTRDLRNNPAVILWGREVQDNARRPK